MAQQEPKTPKTAKKPKPPPLVLYALQAELVKSYQCAGYTLPQEELERIKGLTLYELASEVTALRNLLNTIKDREAVEFARRNQEITERFQQKYMDDFDYGDMG